MAEFTAKDVQALREKTGCGMMDCKKALVEAGGDTEKAMELLRERGLAAAAKKAGRIAAEGLVQCVTADGVTAVVEVNSETDFVSKNADFIAFVNAVGMTVAKQNPADVEALLNLTLDGSGDTVQAALQEKILVIGENMKVRRFARYEGVASHYVHGEGRIGVVVSFDSDVSDKPGFAVMGKDVAMQVAAASPQYVGKEDIPADTIAKEREILTAQAVNEGKPQNIAEKMVEGRIGKYYKEVCLLEQPFVKDGDISVAQYVEKVAKELGGSVKVKAFTRFERGEGIEKREDDFAAEIANLVK